ncbi:hypothetical protein [Pseudomonas salomonii]|uniref:hypothetical protein n=1 Tax=Pseudomonas salomonii TaxID=191391 RepID=UPI00114CD2FD|nr:hypothetical protein [Pseudomonas salomonii]
MSTSHSTGAWIKDVGTGKVEQLNLINTNIPLKTGATIGIGFGGNYPLVFKRSQEVPYEETSIVKNVKTPGKSFRFALMIAFLSALPFIGCAAGAIFGVILILVPGCGQKGFGVADGNRLVGVSTLVTNLLIGKGMVDAIYASRFVESYVTSTLVLVVAQVVINYIILKRSSEKSMKVVAAAKEKLESVMQQQVV